MASRGLTRRSVVATAIGAAVAGAARTRTSPTLAQTATPAASPVAGAARPNILFILTDDLDRRTLEEMPQIRALLTEQGATFGNYLISTSLCAPSRATILRGQYPHNTGVLNNTGANGGFPAFHLLGDEASTVATWLREAGYRTGLIGKYLNRYAKGVPPTFVPPGWTDWHALVDSEADPYNGYQLSENGTVVPYGGKAEDYLTDVLTAKTDAFVRDAAANGEPFFAYVATYAPHMPATPAPRHADAFADFELPRSPSFNEADVSDKPDWVQQQPLLTQEQIDKVTDHDRERLRSLLAVDDMVGTLVSTLEETGQLANTYIVFSSDNGFHLGEHRLPMGKQTAYEESIRVPLVVRGPGVAAGATIDPLALNTDLGPTFADWAGAAVPDFVDGRSLAPLLAGETPAAWRQSVLIEQAPVERTGNGTKRATPEASPEDGGNPTPPAEPPPYDAVRTTRHLYVEYQNGEREYYDLQADPWELDNLAATADPAVLAALSERLAALLTCAGDTCRTLEDAALPG